MGQSKDNAPDPLIGATIAGRYRIVSLIARGGMGKVYRAEQSALGRICALKILSVGDQADRDGEFFKRFSREASTAAKLTHPNSVTIFDYGKDEESGTYFIAMEYLNGRTLHRVIRDEGALPEARVCQIAKQICRSLSEAHSLGLVHRDLKPSNVLLLDRGDERDHVKVLDFGLVKDLTHQDELTQTGTFMGSPKYTAPEQVLGLEITPSADIYSLGVVFYEMITGKPPFDKKVNTATLMAHVSEIPPPFTERNPEVNISAALTSIVFKCLEKNPENRFSSMREVLAAIKRAGGETVEPSDPSRASFASFPDLARSTSDHPSHPGRISYTPTPAPVGSGVHVVSPSPDDSLAPPQQPSTSTLASPAHPRRRSGLTTYAVAFLAAVAGGALVLTFVGRKNDVPTSQPKVIESVLVPVAVPAGAVTASDPASGLRLVRVQSDPPGARVSDRGTEVCIATPCQIVLKAIQADYQLNLTKSGFKTATVVVGPSDEDVSAELEPLAAVSSRDRSSGSEPETTATSTPEAAPTPEVTASPTPETTPSPPPVETTAPPATVAEVPKEPVAAAPAPTPQVLPFQAGMERPVAISAPNPIYTREAIEARVKGIAIARCVITTSGTLTGCSIIKGLPHMNEAILAALSRSRYRPITFQGQTVAVSYTFNFKLVPP